MIIRQLSAFIENKQGRLAEAMKTLSDNGVDVSALSLADTSDYGVLRLIVSDPEKGRQVLSDSGVIVKITEVVAVEIPHRPGALSKTLTVLADSGINVEYLYAFLSSKGQGAYVVLRVADNATAEKVLNEAGYRTLSMDDELEF